LRGAEGPAPLCAMERLLLQVKVLHC
jgi:hypothetical protein